MILGRLKTYLLLTLSGLATLLAFLLKLSTTRSRKLKQKAETFKVQAEHARNVMESDAEIDLEYDKRTKELADEVEQNGTSSELSSPNKW
jgi:hypothetical protein